MIAFRGQRLHVTRSGGDAPVREETQLRHRNQFAQEIDHFARCIRTAARPHMPGDEAAGPNADGGDRGLGGGWRAAGADRAATRPDARAGAGARVTQARNASASVDRIPAGRFAPAVWLGFAAAIRCQAHEVLTHVMPQAPAPPRGSASRHMSGRILGLGRLPRPQVRTS
jgi:hypothetical protein